MEENIWSFFGLGSEGVYIIFVYILFERFSFYVILVVREVGKCEVVW